MITMTQISRVLSLSVMAGVESQVDFSYWVSRNISKYLLYLLSKPCGYNKLMKKDLMKMSGEKNAEKVTRFQGTLFTWGC